MVAAEVRSLAQRSSQASKEIKGLISTSGQGEAGREAGEQGGRSLGEIVTSVKKVADIVSEIAAASQEQSAGVQEVDESVTAMEGVTQKNAALVEEFDGVGELRGPADGAAVAGGAVPAHGRGRREGQCPVAAGGPDSRMSAEAADEAPPAIQARSGALRRAAGSRLSEF